jgi:hypothetical protein
MDVWFCVRRSSQKQKRQEKNCKTYIHTAPSERGTKTSLFP